MEGSPTTIPPLLLRNLLTSLFIYADKSIVSFAEKYKFLQLLRYSLVSTFLFLLRLLPSLFPSLDPSLETFGYPLKASKSENYVSPATCGNNGGGGGDSGIARALTQLLSIVNNIPVSSRKYEVVRSLAENIIDENLLEGSETLREVNCTVLSAAFSRTLRHLEAAVMDRNRSGPSNEVTDVTQAGNENNYHKVNRVLKTVRQFGNMAWTRFGKSRVDLNRSGSSAEKLAAEVLWLAQKMAACGCVDEAVCKWASATHLAWLALSAEPRLQGSLFKVSAFLIKQARDLDMIVEESEEKKKDQEKQTKMKMLMSWLPLLCRASNGTDTPILSISERAVLQRVIEDTIETLDQEEEQEKVLSLWLHHFTYSPSSDWPNLHACYARWCTASRKLLLASPMKHQK